MQVPRNILFLGIGILVCGILLLQMMPGAPRVKEGRQDQMPSAAPRQMLEAPTMPKDANRWVKEFSDAPPSPEADAEESGEDDDETIHDGGLTRSFQFATPPAASASQGPVQVLVKEKTEESASPSRRVLDAEDEEDAEDPNVRLSAEIDALRELAHSGSGDTGLIGGMRVRGATGEAESIEEKKQEEDEEDSDVLPRTTGQVRGFLMLPLMHPRARESSEKQIETLIRSQVNDLYVGFLVDGTFGMDLEYASSVVQRLSSDGRSLLLELFFTNGPTMRKYETTPITAGFSLIDPLSFRYLIQEDPEVQAEFKRIVNAARPLFVQNRNANPNNQNLACVMLEDNLDGASYRKMRQLAAAELGGIASFVRNPCPRCFEGNDSETDGDAVESHAPDQLSSLTGRDGLVLDGIGYNYPGEHAGGSLSMEQARTLAANAMANGIRYLGLWRMDRQGLGSQAIHPDDRNYAVPTEEQVQMDIELLREGLR